MTAVAGLIYTLLALLRDEGATHVGCATDRVIRSFRNQMYAGYKTEVGMPEDLLAQFPLAEQAIEALGLALWPMVEFEADDALASAAARWSGSGSVTRIWICTPDKDLAQCVSGDRVVMRDRRRKVTIDETAVVARWGVPPASIPDYLALVGDSADGYPGLPGWGARSAALVLARFGRLEQIPERASTWGLDVRGPALNAALRDHWADALLYRDLATLRTNVTLGQDSPEELEWRGAYRDRYTAFCSEFGLSRLADRPHRWRE